MVAAAKMPHITIQRVAVADNAHITIQMAAVADATYYNKDGSCG